MVQHKAVGAGGDPKRSVGEGEAVGRSAGLPAVRLESGRGR